MCVRGGCWWYFWRGSWPARLVCTLLCIVLLLSALPARANEQRQLIENAIERFRSIKSESQALRRESQVWKDSSEQKEKRIEQLLSELSDLRGELQTLRANYETLNERDKKRITALLSEVDGLRSSLELVKETSRKSSASWETALQEAAAREAEALARRDVALLWARIGIPAGIAVGVAVGLLLSALR